VLDAAQPARHGRGLGAQGEGTGTGEDLARERRGEAEDLL
jgi:hypothetical protein